MLKEFLPYYKPHLRLFILDMVCAFFAACCDLVYPVVTRNLVNDLIPNRRLEAVLGRCFILLAVYAFKACATHIMQYQGHVVGVRMQADMRRKVFSRLQKMPFSYFDEHKTGVIMSRIVNDLQDIAEFAHHGPEDLSLSLINIIGAFIVLCCVNVPLTCLIFAVVPVLVLFTVKQRARMRKAFLKTKVQIAEVNAGLENSVAGVRVSRAYSGQKAEREKFDGYNGRFVKAREEAYKIMADFASGTDFLMSLLNLETLLSGGLFVYYGKISLGDFLAYLLYINMFIGPIRRLVQFVETFQNAETGFARFSELASAPIEEDAPGAVELENVKGGVVFDDVSFRYTEKDRKTSEVLSHISVEFPVGKTVAVVGPSGGGKTTLCRLIPRFYEISGGSISIDGRDIRSVTRESLRKNIGLVQQEPFLFTGTIYENILYGRFDATREEVVEAAKRANIHDYIISLEDGYDANVGERGVKLSGGQKQRVSIARAFLKNPPILILDEATSALDNVTESQIQESLDELCRGRTTIIVAHRLSTVKNADEIVVIDGRGICERGPHSSLMAKPGGVYAKLYRAQFANI